MRSRISQIGLYVIGLSLLGYTAFRTVHLIQLTLPPDQQIIALFALVAFDGGVLAWTYYYLDGAKGSWQRAISLGMVGVDLIGVIVAFLADTIYQASIVGTIQTPPDQNTIIGAIIILGIVIATNIAAVILCHLTSPDALHAQHQEDAYDKFFDEFWRVLKEKAPELAAEEAPKAAAAWVASTRIKYRGLENGLKAGQSLPETFSLTTGKTPQLEAPKNPSAPLTDWSPYAIAKALHEQKGMDVIQAYMQACVMIGVEAKIASEPQIRSRMARVRTTPTLE